jgi:hypothetical protein
MNVKELADLTGLAGAAQLRSVTIVSCWDVAFAFNHIYSKLKSP